MWFNMPKEKIVASSIQAKNHTWAVQMQFEVDKNLVVVFAAGDGVSSLYFGNGSARIGGSEVPQWKKAAIKFVTLADQFVPLSDKVADYPFPRVGEVRFYILTTDGVYTKIFRSEELTKDNNPFQSLFWAGRDIITECRKHFEQKDSTLTPLKKKKSSHGKKNYPMDTTRK